MEKYKYIILLLMLILGIFLFFVMNNDKNKYQSLKDEFPIINNLNFQKFSGQITKKETHMSMRGVYLVSLSNGQKFSIGGTSLNYLYGVDFDLIKFIAVGDSIFKPSNTDSIFIYRNTRKYYFVLGKTINQELNS
jgi:transposase